MKTAVLCGFSGLLARPTLERGRARLASLARGPVPEAPAIFESDRALALAAGQLTTEQFLVGLARSLSIDAPYEKMVEAWNESLAPWPEVLDVVSRTLDGGHPAYLVATIDELRFGHLEPLMPVLGRFSGRAFSFDMHMVQPEPLFYDDALARFDLKAAQCVYIDGSLSAVEGARAAGIPSFLFRGDVKPLLDFLRRWDHDV